MENAGRGVADLIIKDLSGRLSKGALILCGPGNNGGDGFVVARHLFQKGIKMEVIVLSKKEAYRGDAETNYRIAEKIGLDIKVCVEDESIPDLMETFDSTGVIVDAIFGTGISKDIRGRFLKVIEFSNNSPAPVVSVDIPSGLSADTGKIFGACIHAETTVTMAFPKMGMFTPKAKDYVVKLHVVDIGIPSKLTEEKDFKCVLLEEDTAKSLFRQRPLWAHKGTFGHLLVVAGSRGKTGAGALGATGALRSGAGLVTVASPRSIQPVYSQKLTEAMTEGLSETEEGSIAKAAVSELRTMIEKKKAVVVGPGAGLCRETREALLVLIKNIPLPMVIDADALTAIGDRFDLLKDCSHPRILTPHLGEMARLTGAVIPEIEEDRFNMVRDYASASGAYVVLKGYRSLVASPDGRLAVNTSGNQGMASGGMGDVLSGIIGGLLAQGYSPWKAACLGVYAHGLSGDILSRERGPYGYLAGEVADNLPGVWSILSP
jgi:NAD(P)H-hydrate epimerase